jgi:tetratricopeptide (TPR) repeat protein
MESKVAELPLSHKAWAWFEKNQKQALTSASVVVIVGLIIWFFVWQNGEKQVQASEELSSIAVRQISAAAAGSQDAPQAYLKVASDYPKSKAAARALLLAAGALFTEGKYAESQALFERFTREFHDSPLLGEGLLGVASCLEAQGKTDQAAGAYKDLITRHPADSVAPQAKFSLAGLYEVQKRPELARDLYDQVERESRYGILGGEAGLRLEELAQKNPNLTPAVTVPTPSPPPLLSVPAGTNTNPPAPMTKQ